LLKGWMGQFDLRWEFVGASGLWFDAAC